MSRYKQSFIKGTLILLAAGVINRILGFVPRMMLPRIIGAEGMGLYQLGYPFLLLVLTVVTGGIPLAVAKLVAEAESEGNERRIRRILHQSLILTGSLSIFFTIICILASQWITTYLLTDSRVYYTFLVMSPIIPIVAVSSVYRGYFQGRHNMIPTAVSQVVETLVRIVTVLSFSYIMLPYGIEYAAAGAMAGVMIGELCGMGVLLRQYKQTRVQYPTNLSHSSNRSNVRSLLKIAVPVTASKLVGSGSFFLESIFIVQSLAVAGVVTTVATTQYGILQGMVIPILLLPSALTYSLSVSLVPALTEAAARNDKKVIQQRLYQCLRLTLVTAAPFVVLMFVLADPISYYLYKNSDAGALLKWMAPVALFLYFQPPLQAALQALNKPGTALRNTFIGSAVKLILIYPLVVKLQLGIVGAVIAINLNIVLVTALHWTSVVRLFHFSMKGSEFSKTVLGMIMMGVILYAMMSTAWSSLPLVRFLTACFISVFVYFLYAIWIKLIDVNDFVKIPWLGIWLVKWFK